MSTNTDYYQLLHVQRDAPVAVIKASYRAMMQKMQHHPDLGGDAQVAQQLNLAVSVLCDPYKRGLYDQSLGEHPDHSSCENGVSASQPGDDKVQPGAESGSGNKHRPANHQPSPYPELPAKARCFFCGSTQADEMLGGTDQYARSRACARCGGAMTPIRAFTQHDSEELRRLYRHSHAAPARLWHQWPQLQAAEAMMLDFSPIGCALDCTDGFSVGHTLMVRTELFNAIAQVRSCRASSASGLHMLGLEFITLDLNSSPGNLIQVQV